MLLHVDLTRSTCIRHVSKECRPTLTRYDIELPLLLVVRLPMHKCPYTQQEDEPSHIHGAGHKEGQRRQATPITLSS